MCDYEFYRKLEDLGRRYINDFGYMPHITDYNCSREEFITALECSLLDRTSIDTYLQKKISH